MRYVMAEKNINAYCSICNSGYHVCNSCKDEKTFKPWRTVADSIEHYKIYLAIYGYTMTKDKITARKELQSCNLEGLENFKPEIQSVIKDIMTETRKSKNISKKENMESENDIS